MATHQTVRLSRGRHKSAQEGACVMELASMLAGEKFSDHPRSVSRVIGAFLRTYNDGVTDELRQDLYAYAARIVGTDASLLTERRRSRRCGSWLRNLGERVRAPGAHRATIAASWAANMARSDPSGAYHLRALALVDELIEIGGASAGASDLGRLLSRPGAVDGMGGGFIEAGGRSDST